MRIENKVRRVWKSGCSLRTYERIHSGVSPITNNMFRDIISDNLTLWRDILDNFALGKIRCETIGLGTQDLVRI